MNNDSVIHYDVIIVGAGPAGTSCAMALKGSGLNILLLDKESFPRDKICGDAIAGRSIKTLDKFAPALVEEIRGFEMKELILRTCIFIDNNKPFTIDWKNETYCIKRYDFDALLLKYALKNDSLTFKPNFKVDHVSKHEGKICVGNKKTDTYYSANILVAADGSQSFLAKQLIDLKLDPANFSAAVRAYYSNVEGIVPHQTELHIYKENLPGFLWIFPLNKTQVNVGFGMLSSEISKRNINLTTLYAYYFTTPTVKRSLSGCRP
ncbi:MAG: FAD-binding protein [Sphingobacteriaceae bacterium]|nr:MAG: FAD-binding protein [Sphingobacteriaceae bacterium]